MHAHSPASIRLMMALTPKRFFSLSASLSLFSALTLFSHAHLWSLKLSLSRITDVEDGQISDSPKTGSNLAMVRTNEEGDLFGNVGISEVDDSAAEDLRLTEVSISMEPRFKEHLTEGYHRDKVMRHIIQGIEKNPRLQDPYFWNVQEERLYFLSDGKRRLCIPAGPLRLELLNSKLCHDVPSSGHPG